MDDNKDDLEWKVKIRLFRQAILVITKHIIVIKRVKEVNHMGGRKAKER